MGNVLHAVMMLFTALAVYFFLKPRIERMGSEKKKKDWRGVLRIFLTLAILSLVFALLGAWSDQFNSADHRLNEAARAINADSPRMIENGVRRERVEVGPGNVLTYIMTFVEVTADQFDRAYWEEKVKAPARINLLAQPEIQEFLRQGTRVVYRFQARDGVRVDEFSLSPTELQDKQDDPLP